MGAKTKIAWGDSTWNPFSGCTHVSPGCDHCYAETVAERFRGGPAYPNGFEPTLHSHRLGLPAQWSTKPRRVFVNSMSDLHHEAFDDAAIAAVYDAMLATPVHDYLVLTKRPQRMAAFLLGPETARAVHAADLTASPETTGLGGYLAARGLAALPDHIWVGTSIEDDRYTFRADWLRTIPAPVRALSCEPLLGPLPSLRLVGIDWVIVGGESGQDHRRMRHEWARDLLNRCRPCTSCHGSGWVEDEGYQGPDWMDAADWARSGDYERTPGDGLIACGCNIPVDQVEYLPPRDPVAFFFKQSSGARSGEHPYLVNEDGNDERIQEYPLPHPSHPTRRTSPVGVYTSEAPE
jgi:protein gp37